MTRYHYYLRFILTLNDNAKGKQQLMNKGNPSHLYLHLVASPGTVPWIEQLIAKSYKSSHSSHSAIYFNSIIHGIRLVLKVIYKRHRVQVFTIRSNVTIVAHGYFPAVIGLIFKLLLGLEYIIVHHHPPHFFFQKSNIRSRMHQILHHVTDHFAMKIQSLSTEVSNHLRQIGNLKNREIGHGVAHTFIDSFKGIPSRLESPYRILMVGRIAKEKNYDYAFKLFRNMIVSGIDFKVEIAGTGSISDIHQLKTSLIHMQLNNHVTFLGHVDEIMDVYRQNQVLLHVGLTESYGQVLIEAPLQGLRVISTNVGVASQLHADFPEILTLITGKSEGQDCMQIIDSLEKTLDFNFQFNKKFASYVDRLHSFKVCQEMTLDFIVS
jgi:glycosyltransferase involved in cell wall biosynthesis